MRPTLLSKPPTKLIQSRAIAYLCHISRRGVGNLTSTLKLKQNPSPSFVSFADNVESGTLI